MAHTETAVLVLEDGTRYVGAAYGAPGRTVGEAVFATGMTGYQETLTDPSYAGQIILMTAPHIGNTGVNEHDVESSRMWAAGFIVREPARMVSNFRATGALENALRAEGVVGISGIDTRAVTRRLRDAGVMRAGIFSGADAAMDAAEQLALVRGSAEMSGSNRSADVSTPEPYTVDAEGEAVARVVVLDLGVKASTLRYLAARHLTVTVLPQSVSAKELLALNPDGVFFSNGPGDPAASDAQVQVLQEVLRARIPFFGICFGNQLFGRALGFPTYKLPFGHRGINQPVREVATGRIEITSHNHGFAVDMPVDGPVASPSGFGQVRASHVNLNDQVVEGIRALDLPAFSVQFHPEAAAGPHDTNYLFDSFRDLVVAHTQTRAAAAASHTEDN